MTGGQEHAVNASWDKAARVLCVRLDSIGDVLMTTPAVRALKESVPGRRLFFLTSSNGAEAARLVPEIDEVIVYDAPWMKAAPGRSESSADRAAIERLRGLGLDAAVIFTVYSQNPLPAALLCYLADIPLRLAYCRENPYQLLTDHVPENEPGWVRGNGGPESAGLPGTEMAGGVRHEVRRQLDLVANAGCTTGNERLSLKVPDDAVSYVCGLLEEAGIEGKPFIVVHPGATAPSRRYPPGSFIDACRALCAETDLPMVFTGDESEVPLVDAIRGCLGARTWSFAGRLDLSGLAALIGSAALLISNNTGPAHVAAALGTPVVSLYALTNPQHAPWRVPSKVLFHDVPCKYCYKSVCPRGTNECLGLVAPQDAVRAALELLAPCLHSA